MGCFRPKTSKTMKSYASPESNQEPKNNLRQQLLLQIPQCKIHLMEGGEAIELANGNFNLLQIFDENVSLATIVQIGDHHDELLQWPLTKDEPVVKLDGLNYLFTLPMKDGDVPLSYGVTFLDQYCSGSSNLEVLDSFLDEHTCFTGLMKKKKSGRSNNVEWKEFAPNVEDYNNVLAKAIAGGTGQIVKGIFICSNAYTNQVHKGGEMIVSRAAEEKNGSTALQKKSRNKNSGPPNNNKVNKSLKRVRRLSKMTEKLSKTMLNGVGIVSGSVMAPMVKSQAGKKFLSMVPGEVLLASLDAVNKVLDAAEVAEKRALSATSKATTRMVSNRFGESAGEATEDVFATAGHCCGTAWNIFKIRKAINPASSVTAGMLKNAAKANKYK